MVHCIFSSNMCYPSEATSKERAMSKQKETKTNVMREIEAAGVPFESHLFPCEKALSGVEVANLLGQDPDQTFKTLVTVAKSGEHYVFMVPVAEELDLKKAATAVGEKAVSMLKSKELLPLTGYVHGGCSPVGMKKLFTTTIDETAQLFDTIMFSGGRIGCQVELAPSDLEKVIPLRYADITVS